MLGPLRVLRDGEPVPVRAGKQRVLLATLLLRANEVVSATELIDRLWGAEPGERARDNLYQYVRRLRQELGSADLIQTAPAGYLIHVEPGRLDTARFDKLVARAAELAAAGDLAGESAVLSAALALWRGPALVDIESDSLRQVDGARLTEQRLQVIERWIEVELELGHHHEVIGELTRLTREHPLRERLWYQLIVAQSRGGRQADALESYQIIRRILSDELGIDPGADLQRLHQALLAGELVASPEPGGSVTPCQLPSDIGDFVGRTQQIDALRWLLAPGTRTAVPVSVITGTGGVGKTALAVHVAHRLRESFSDGQLYVNLRGAGPCPAQPADVLARLLRDLGVAGTLIPDEPERREAMYRSLLADRHVLVILDDAADESQVQPLLPGSASCGVLVTSRARLTALAGAHRLELDVLPSGRSIELLGRVAGTRRLSTEPGQATELARLCGGLPLAVRIAGARLAARPHWTVGELVCRLVDERRRLDELVHGALEVRTSLGLSYLGLDPLAQTVFRRLGLLDTADFAAWVAAVVTSVEPTEATDAVERLVDARLLEVVTRDDLGLTRYRFHDLVRVYARERAEAEDSPEDRAAALERALGAWLALAEHAYRSVNGGDYTLVHGTALRPRPLEVWPLVTAEPLRWFETERAGIVAAVGQSVHNGLDELCWDLAITGGALAELRSRHVEMSRIFDEALLATRAAGNRRGEAAVLAELGFLHLTRQRYHRAADCLEESDRLFAAVADEHGRAQAGRHLARLDYLSGQLDRALQRYQRVRVVFRDTGNLIAEADALRGIGLVHADRGRADRARHYFEYAVHKAREAGAPRETAQMLYRLGELSLARGRLGPAMAAFEEVLATVRELGDLRGQAYALHGLGRTHLREGHRTEAMLLLNQAKLIANEIGERLVEGQIRNALGELAEQQGDLATAVAHLTDAASLFAEINAPSWRARSLHALGNVHSAAGNRTAAGLSWTEAVELYTRLGSPEADRLATQLANLRQPLTI